VSRAILSRRITARALSATTFKSTTPITIQATTPKLTATTIKTEQIGAMGSSNTISSSKEISTIMTIKDLE
jgi:hypothetical protein